MSDFIITDAPLAGKLNLIPTYAICICGKDNALLAGVRADGSIEYGPNYTPDEAARTFWEAIGTGWIGFLAPLVAREVEAKHAALIAENARLRTFAEKVAATDLRDVNSYAHGWVKSFIDAARSALSDNPARSANRSEK